MVICYDIVGQTYYPIMIETLSARIDAESGVIFSDTLLMHMHRRFVGDVLTLEEDGMS